MAAVLESMHAMHQLQLQGSYTGLAGVKLKLMHVGDQQPLQGFSDV